jgi:hypothetical protein
MNVVTLIKRGKQTKIDVGNKYWVCPAGLIKVSHLAPSELTEKILKGTYDTFQVMSKITGQYLL